MNESHDLIGSENGRQYCSKCGAVFIDGVFYDLFNLNIDPNISCSSFKEIIKSLFEEVYGSDHDFEVLPNYDFSVRSCRVCGLKVGLTRKLNPFIYRNYKDLSCTTCEAVLMHKAMK